MKILPRYKKCFVCGNENPLGLKLTFKTDGNKVYTSLNLNENYIGYKDHIHGGIISCLVDEAMGWACISKGKDFYYTVDLEIRYLAPVRPNTDITVCAWVVSEKGKIFFTEAEIVDQENKKLIKAKAKFFPAKENENEEILNYLSHDEKDRKVCWEDL